ncbi:hypothetical protein D3C71_1790560 [compost metagenome]
MLNETVGNACPKKPNNNPHRISVPPFSPTKTVGGYNTYINGNAAVSIIAEFMSGGSVLTTCPVKNRKMLYANADRSPYSIPSMLSSPQSVSSTFTASIVPAKIRAIASPSARLGHLRFAIQSMAIVIHVN